MNWSVPSHRANSVSSFAAARRSRPDGCGRLPADDDVARLDRLTAEHSRRDAAEAKLLLQVHDELDFSVPEGEIEELSAIVKDVMEHIVDLRVPLDVDVSYADNWAEAH